MKRKPPEDDRQQSINFDVCRPFHGGDECSEAANDSIHGSKSALRSKVLAWLDERGAAGGTSDEVEQALNLRHQTASARLRELCIFGQAVKTKERRPTRSGRNAWVIVTKGVVIT